MEVYIPPLKIQGSKTKLIAWIIDNIVWDKQGTWIEPFMGSGVVGFNFKPKRAEFYDINPHIIGFYNAIKNGYISHRKAKAFLEIEGKKLLNNEDYYYEVRDRFNEHHDPLDFLFLNRSCYNGLVRFNKNGKFNSPFTKVRTRFNAKYINMIALPIITKESPPL